MSTCMYAGFLLNYLFPTHLDQRISLISTLNTPGHAAAYPWAILIFVELAAVLWWDGKHIKDTRGPPMNPLYIIN